MSGSSGFGPWWTKVAPSSAPRASPGSRSTVGDHNVGALLGEATRDGPSDAAGAARDNRHLAGKTRTGCFAHAIHLRAARPAHRVGSIGVGCALFQLRRSASLEKRPDRLGRESAAG